MNTKAINIFRITSYAIAILCFACFVYALIVGDNLALPWQLEDTYKTRPLLLEYFQINGEPSGLYADQLISWQKFTTGDIEYLDWPVTLTLVVFFLSLVSVTTVVTYFDRFSYFITSGIVIFVLIQLRLEELGISDTYLTYGVILGYFICSYLFQSFYPNAALWKRLTASILLYGGLVLIIGLFANMSHPHLVSISFGIIGPVIFSAIFIIFIAGDNIYSLFKLTTQGSTNGKNSLKHFSIIGFIYVALSAMLFLQRTGYTEVDIFFVNPYVLLTLSIVSGYFTLEKKLESHSANFDLRLVKYWLYPIATSLTLSFVAFAHLSINDSFVNAIEWVIIISHFTFGVVFYGYALINFIPPLVENLEVWPVFFKGLRTPALTARLIAFALFIGGFFYLENRPYYQVKAGQFSMLAALAEKIDNDLLTDQYYKQSIYFDFYNFKANYALTRFAKRKQEIEEVPAKLNSILQGAYNPKARVAFANYYADRELLYRELTALMNSQESLDNPYVKNNLGLSHYRYSNYDSAYKYFESNQKESSAVSEGNLAALNYDLAARVNFDTTLNYQHTDNAFVMINRQALANAQGTALDFNLSLNKDTLINREEVYYLYNAALSQTSNQKEQIIEALNFYIQNPKNNAYKRFLSIAKAIAYYNLNKVNQAFKAIDEVIATSQGAAGFPYFAKAVWAFNQGQAEMTIENLNLAQRSGYKEPQVKEFIDNIKQINDYNQKADISEELLALQTEKSQLDSVQYIGKLVEIASLNAFDEETTLKAIEELKANHIDEETIYSILLEAININPGSTSLTENYIYQCAQTGLSSFAQTALDKLESKLSPSDYQAVKQRFKKILEERKKELFK